MDFLNIMKEKAKSNKKTIILPATGVLEPRNIEAAGKILKEGIADLILFGKKDELMKAAGPDCDLSAATFIDPQNYERKQEMIDTLVEIRKKKGMTPEVAAKALEDPLTFGIMLVKLGVADGMVSGAINSTAAVLRPALQILKTAPGASIVSSFFVMCCKDNTYGEDGVLFFADCAVNQNPNPEELANIAVSTGKSFETFMGVPAKVAMLSHSTKGSAKHPDVDKVTEATKIAKELAPQMQLDGELQCDAAIVPSVGSLKAPESTVAGQANVLIFPDIDAGNIGYKLVQRFAGAEAYGPVLQGISKPVNDLSRGCFADDIVATVAITAVQAQMA